MEEINCTLPTSTKSQDRLEPEGWWCWLPITSPPTNQKNVHELITHPATLSLSLSLKTFPWKPSGGVRAFWALATWTPCLAPCDKHCPFLHHNLVSVDWLYCMHGRADPGFGSFTPSPSCWSPFHTFTLSQTKLLEYNNAAVPDNDNNWICNTANQNDNSCAFFFF